MFFDRPYLRVSTIFLKMKASPKDRLLNFEEKQTKHLHLHTLISNLNVEGSADELRLVTACTAV